MARTMACLFAFGLAVLSAACEPVEPVGLPDPGPNGVELTVSTEPAGGVISVDGRLVGKSPQTFKLRAGPHRLSATLSGYFPLQQPVSVSAEGPKDVRLTMIASH